MIVGFVGLREPGNYFKRKVASLFSEKIFEFDHLSKELQNNVFNIYGYPNDLTLRTQEETRCLLRHNLSIVHDSMYMDYMSKELVDKVFRKNDNKSREIQGVILDIDTAKEYKSIRTYLVRPSKNNLPTRYNKIVLIENDALLTAYYNKNYNDFINFEVDAVISSEDEDLEKTIENLVLKWTNK